MARGRGRPPAPPPPYESLTSKDYKAFVQSFETIDKEARMLAEDRSQLKKDWRPKGLDGASHDFIMKWKRKIEAGKGTVQDLFSQLDRCRFYAETLFGDAPQVEMFREDKPAAPADGAAAETKPEGDAKKPAETAVNKAAQGNGNGKAAAAKKGNGAGAKGKVSAGDAEGALEAAKQHLGTAEPAGVA